MKSKTVKTSASMALVAAVTLPLVKTQAAFAANSDCGVDTFFNWGCSTGSGDKVTVVLIQVLNWLAVGVTLAVIGGVIYGSIMYTTAGGNPQQSQKAMGIIRNAFIALVMYFAMWALLNWLVPGGIFN